MTTTLREHTDFIREEYKHRTVDQLLQILQDQFQIDVKKSSLEKFLRESGFTKKKKGKDWDWVDHHVNERKRKGKDSELIICGEVVPEEKRRKEVARHVSTLTQFSRGAQAPATPAGWEIKTPADVSEERTPSPPNSPVYQRPTPALDESELSMLSSISTSFPTVEASNDPFCSTRKEVTHANVIKTGGTAAEPSSSQRPKLSSETVATDTDLLFPPISAIWDSPMEANSGRTKLNDESLARLMRNCGLFMSYWDWVGASMFSDSIQDRYENISLLISTLIPWDPDAMEYQDDFGLEIEAFVGIEVMRAVYHGDSTRLESALAKIELEVNKDVLQTALMIATSHGNTTFVEFLLSAGFCDINWQATDGTTCLHQAVIQNQPEVVELLLLHHPDLEIKCRMGETAFFKICGSREHEAVSSLLLKAGAETHTSNIKGVGALCQAAASNDQVAINTMFSRGMSASEGTLICDWCPIHSPAQRTNIGIEHMDLDI